GVARRTLLRGGRRRSVARGTGLTAATSSSPLLRTWGARGRDARFDDRPAAHHRLPACLEHCLERFDAVVGGFEEEVVYHRLCLLELFYQGERHGSAPPLAAPPVGA